MRKWLEAAAGRALVPVLAVAALACPASAPAREGAPLEKVPVHKVDLERLYAAPGGDARRDRDRTRVEILSGRNHRIHHMLEGRHVSRRAQDRLRAAGLGPARSPLDPAAKQEEVTLRVLLVRVGFETDASGELTSVTTDGDFQLGEPGPDDRIDPPPHDKAYFEAHLRGLSEYYTSQSGGRLRIDGRVLPDGETDCYKLSDLADYGPGEGSFWSLESLETLVRDMILLADAESPADGVSLADYDDDDPLTYVIFVHAGADWQSDINQDSPNDIPTFFVVLGEPQALASVDGETGQAGALSECSIIPETTSQDGWLGSIAGALYHEFGHALGLPDIYDTTTGLPAVGYWDLMDSGPNLIANIGLAHATIPDSIEVYQVAGLLPPSLSAWCKWYLGWLDVRTLSGAETAVRLPAVQVDEDHYARWYSGNAVNGAPFDFRREYPQALIGGVSPREFWLMENRWVPWSGAEMPDVTGIGFVRDPESGVFLYMGGDPWDPDGDDGPLEEAPRNTGMYDYFLPDGGLLVWHVNRDAIDAGMPENTVNGEGLGLRLLEADGIQDVGVFEAYTLGFFGSSRDPFHRDTRTELGQEGRPGTRAYDRSWTGLELDGLSANDATMRFDARVLPLVAGAPVALAPRGDAPRRLDPMTLTPWRATGVHGPEPTDLLVAASAADTLGPSHLFVFDAAGDAPLTAPAGAPAGAWVELAAPLAGPPLVATFGGTGRDHLVYGTRDGGVTAWLDVALLGDLLPSWGPVAAGDTLSQAPSPATLPDGTVRLLCCLEPGRLQVLDESGARFGAPYDLAAAAETDVGRFSAAPLPVTAPYGVPRWFVVTERRWFLIDPTAEDGAPLDHGAILVAPYAGGRHAVALLEQDGASQLVVFGADGAESHEFRAHLPVASGSWRSVEGDVLADPAVADLDADGRLDLVFATATHLHARAANGAPLPGWPLELLMQFPFAAETALDGGLAVFDADGDGRNEVFATTDQGHLTGWSAAAELLPRLPLLWGDRGTSVAAVGGLVEGGRALWLADAGGRATTATAPNPSGGRVVGYLPASAADAGGTAEWLGPRGGARRTGPVGTAADLGPLSTVAAEQDRFFAYPNPARGDRATFRYFSPAAGAARLVIYNLEGEEVASLAHDGAAGVVEEIRWPLAGLASGVYLCRLDAPASDGGRTRRVIRLAVER